MSSVVRNSLPPLPRLRELFEADFEKGILYRRTSVRGGRGGKGAVAGCAQKRTGRKMVTVDGTSYCVSRIIWMLHTGRDPGNQYIDHINGDPSDDRLENLRMVSPGENIINRGTRTQTGIRGVYLFPQRYKDGSPKYVVQLCRAVKRNPDGTYKRKTYHYGTFRDLELAKARAAEMIEAWGMAEFLPAEELAAADYGFAVCADF
jgi:hypothetical protein